MKITICSSINFTDKIKEIADNLTELGHEVGLPYMTKKILAGEISLEKFLKTKEKHGDSEFRIKAEEDLIRRHYKLIKDSDAILVINIDKKGVKNYIGGNTFLEMGFAHILEKKIFLLNPIPEISYSDEIKAMKPMILNNDLNKIS